MEVPGMEATKMTESHLNSAAAFVEGGIQEAHDDACSICLEAFCDSDPSTVTSCKHEFHLQCILEWCQRSLQCPMCWQPISLKDPTSQELLEAIEREKSFRFNRQQNATIFHHPIPTLRDFEHLSVGANDAELEEYIIQHLAAAAEMGRTHRTTRRDGQRSRATAHGHPQLMVFSTHPNAPARPVSASPALSDGDHEPVPAITAIGPSVPLSSVEEPLQGFPQLPSAQTDQIPPASAAGSSVLAVNQDGLSFSNRNSAGQSSPVNQDRAGPSELQSFSESLKSRFSAVSTRYKESITKSTRGWKEKLFSRNTSMADIGSEVRREVTAGIASVSRLMERLETGENSRAPSSSVSSNLEGGPVTELGNQRTVVTRGITPMNDNRTSASRAVSSGQN